MSERPHYLEHRKRLRERFRTTGFEGFRDYEALELMLTYAIPRRDVKPLAKSLIKRFGSFKAVLDATEEELKEVKGIKENSSTFVLALKASAVLYRRGAIKGGPQVSSTMELLDYLDTAMGGLRDEQFRVVFLNSLNEIIADEALGDGTVDQSVVYPRKVIERALAHKATALILVHNHPGGSVKPSQEDIKLTREITTIARSLGLRVHDHLIVSKGEHFSFLEHGKMPA